VIWLPIVKTGFSEVMAPERSWNPVSPYPADFFPFHPQKIHTLEVRPAANQVTGRHGDELAGAPWRSRSSAPDSPTIPTVSPAFNMERDSVHGPDRSGENMKVNSKIFYVRSRFHINILFFRFCDKSCQTIGRGRIRFHQKPNLPSPENDYVLNSSCSRRRASSIFKLQQFQKLDSRFPGMPAFAPLRRSLQGRGS